MISKTPDASFVPAGLDCSDFARIQPLYQALLDREVASPEALEQWLLDFSSLTAAVSEYGSRCYIDKSCHTEDPAIEKAFLHYVENIQPRIKPLYFELQKKYLASPHRGHGPLAQTQYQVLDREWKTEVELFRPENIPLQTEQTKLTSEYDKVCGAMIVSYEGREYTLQQLARFQEEPDRAARERTWAVAEKRRAEDRGKIEGLFDQLLALRSRIAANAGCAGFRDYIWKAYSRFDYAPEDCLRFAEAIEKTCLPVVEQLNDRRRRNLGLSLLRPWDLGVDPLNRPALRPFGENEVNLFLQRTSAIFDRVSPDLGQRFRQLQPGRNLDLDSRKGKRPGGYQSSLEQSREPFIFMNAAGLHRDVETLLHEGGHAFHYMAARDMPLVFLRHAPIEFCEVASMSMELLGDDHLDVFYSPADAARAKRKHLEDVVRLLPWIATIDSFQHWIYTHPGHSPKDRADAWMTTHKRFSSAMVDWSGIDDVRRHFWHRQLHLFSVPFYYVEYGIAQLGALQVYFNYKRDPKAALARLLEAFALGGSRPLPELFTAAGVRFDFSISALEPLMKAVGEELAQLPA